MPLIPAFRREKQADPCAFNVSLVYKARSGSVKVIY